MTLELEDRLWEQLAAAADREAARGRTARAAATARGALPAWRLRTAAVAVAATAAVVALVIAVTPETRAPQWHAERFGVQGGDASAAVAGHGALWSYDERSGRVLRLDPRTHRVVARVALPATAGPMSIASGAGAVWAFPSTPIRHSAAAPPHPPAAELFRIDPLTDRVVARGVLRAPDGSTLRPVDAVALPDAVWVWGEAGAQRVDPRSNRVTAAVRPRGQRVMGFAATDSRVSFFTDMAELATFDARTGERLASVPLDGAVGGEDLVAVGNDVVTYRQGGTLASVDPITGRARWTARVGSKPRDMAIGDGRLWLLLAEPGSRANELRALDPGDGHVVARVALPADDGRMVAAAGDMPMVTTQGGDLIAVHLPR